MSRFVMKMLDRLSIAQAQGGAGTGQAGGNWRDNIFWLIGWLAVGTALKSFSLIL